MQALAFYCLRQKTRPSEEEASIYLLSILVEHLDAKGVEAIIDSLKHSDQMNMSVANLVHGDDVEGQFRNFIISCGGQRYLDNPNAYDIEMLVAQTGNPPEPTCLAVVLERGDATIVQSKSEKDMAESFLVRGQLWERHLRWLDAMICYQIGLDLCPGHPELLFRLGVIQMRYSEHYGNAVKNLQQASEANPERADFANGLACCYLALADADDVKIQGVTREDLLEMALNLLERVCALGTDDTEVVARLQSLRNRLGKQSKDSFFG